MKKLIAAIFSLFVLASAAGAQPRFGEPRFKPDFYGSKALGLRGGVQGVDLDYQLWTGAMSFLEFDGGMEFGHGACWQNIPSEEVRKGSGVRGTILYNRLLEGGFFPRSSGWTTFFGLGFTTGYVQDVVRFSRKEMDSYASQLIDPDKLGLSEIAGKNQRAMGFMFGLCLNLGIEYSFVTVPAEISFDVRPVFGCHVNERLTSGGFTIEDSRKKGFYTYGLWGFIPSVSIRYSF
ncbi:MAG: hypothetical protein HUJ94_05520 [Bacteroidales bacterium]|nr:hypothetical protein [Bacteroidales bacterium]